MSGFIWMGVLVGVWALLSLIGGERLRQQQIADAERRAKLAAESDDAAH